MNVDEREFIGRHIHRKFFEFGQKRIGKHKLKYSLALVKT